MKITELLLTELDQEAVGTRKTLQNVPEGKNDWKPHEKSMPLGNLATIVATTPAWLGREYGRIRHQSARWIEIQTATLENSQRTTRAIREQPKEGREVLQKTTDDRLLNTKWRMLYAGKLMMEQTRYEAIREGVLNHMAHHRGQLTVYLRLNQQKVPAIYGPSADEGK